MIKFSTGRGSRVKHSTGREWDELEKVRTPWIPRTASDALKERIGKVWKPIIDVFEEEEHVVVVAELPGMEETDVAYEVKNGILVISSHGGRKYCEEVTFPCPVSVGEIEASWRNNILELRLKRVGR